jgi:hypothetical protein
VESAEGTTTDLPQGLSVALSAVAIFPGFCCPSGRLNLTRRANFDGLPVATLHHPGFTDLPVVWGYPINTVLARKKRLAFKCGTIDAIEGATKMDIRGFFHKAFSSSLKVVTNAGVKAVTGPVKDISGTAKDV